MINRQRNVILQETEEVVKYSYNLLALTFCWIYSLCLASVVFVGYSFHMVKLHPLYYPNVFDWTWNARC